MKNDQKCRNSDKWLVWKYLRDKAGINIFIPFEDFERMPSFESIRRIRQYIQNTEKKFLPTDPKVRIERKVNEEEWREWLTKARAYGLEL